MSPPHRVNTYPERYDQALHYARDQHLPPDHPRPCFTRDWPPENVVLLVRYGEWLAGGGASEYVIRTIYVPMAGHVLGLNLKPHPQLDLETDLGCALDYVKAKGVGPDWADVCRNALDKFRRFLLHERGHVEVKSTPYQVEPHTEGLPAWLVQNLQRFQHIQQRNWRPARLEDNIRRFWSGHLRTWRFLVEQCGVQEFADLKRQHLFDYIDQRLSAGHATTGVNGDLRALRSFLFYLQDQGCTVPQALLRVPGLKEGDTLPKFLTDDQVRRLRDDFEQRLQQAQSASQRRDALLDRAAFYLLWQSALRLGEVEELRLEDLDLSGRRLTVRQSKGMKDRTVFLTDTTAGAIEAYLEVRGAGPTDHVLLYRNQPLCKDLIRGRIKAAGQRVGVNVYPHRLRHTCATQLLNAGCRVTSIQKFLGHKRLNSTMVYARVHEQTAADDYRAAMQQIEQRLDLLAGAQAPASGAIAPDERQQLIGLAAQMAQPALSQPARLEIAAQMRQVLTGLEAPSTVPTVSGPQRNRPPPVYDFPAVNPA